MSALSSCHTKCLPLRLGPCLAVWNPRCSSGHSQTLVCDSHIDSIDFIQVVFQFISAHES